MAGLAIRNFTRRKNVPRALFSRIVRESLPGWDVSLVFVGPTKARELNKRLRNKDYVPNVLSYVVGDKNGEIIICGSEAAKQASDFSLSTADFLLFLFIHGLLHIKGRVHGATMEKCERELLGKFSKSDVRSLPNVTSHRNRNRHRNLPGKDSRRRGARR